MLPWLIVVPRVALFGRGALGLCYGSGHPNKTAKSSVLSFTNPSNAVSFSCTGFLYLLKRGGREVCRWQGRCSPRLTAGAQLVFTEPSLVLRDKNNKPVGFILVFPFPRLNTICRALKLARTPSVCFYRHRARRWGTGTVSLPPLLFFWRKLGAYYQNLRSNRIAVPSLTEKASIRKPISTLRIVDLLAAHGRLLRGSFFVELEL